MARLLQGYAIFDLADQPVSDVVCFPVFRNQRPSYRLYQPWECPQHPPQTWALGHSPAPVFLDCTMFTLEKTASSVSVPPHFGHLIRLFSRSLMEAITLNSSPHRHRKS
jgi:hypothetical protein